MMVLFRRTKLQVVNLWGGLVSLVPILFPIVVVFGLLGEDGVAVDMGTAIAASLALGLTILGTIQFLSWFRWSLREGLDRHSAIQEASSCCAFSLLQMTLFICVGLSLFAVSSFVPIQRFGLILSAMLGIGLLSNLFCCRPCWPVRSAHISARGYRPRNRPAMSTMGSATRWRTSLRSNTPVPG